MTGPGPDLRSSSGPTASVGAGRGSFGAWILASTIIGSSMVFIDGTAVNVALPVMQRDLHATIAQSQWFVEAYALFLAALILVGGSLGDHFGRKRMFMAGVAGFAVASAACGISQTAFELTVARAAQGMASALLTPGSLAIIGASFSPRERGGAIGIWSSLTAVTSAAGPVLAGFIVQAASWRWIFFINIPLALATVAIASCCVPESQDDEVTHRVDWWGALLATSGLGALVYGLIAASGGGWNSSDIAISAAGLVLLGAFLAFERRAPAPMMPLSLFSNRTFSAINLMTLFLYAALGGALFFLPFNLIQVHEYSPTAAGAALLPYVALISLLSPLTGRLAPRLGSKPLLVAGSFVTAIAFLALALPATSGGYWTTFFPGMVVLGVGMALVVSPLTTAVMECVDPAHFGVASGINNAVARTAGLLAIAAITLAVVATFNRSLDVGLNHVQPPLPPTVRAAVDEQRAQLGDLRAPSWASPAEQTATRAAVAHAYVDGFRVAMLIGAALALASALCGALAIAAPVRR